MEFFHKVSTFPFMHTRRAWYAVSGLAVIASIILVFVRGLNWGIDFTGGVVLEFKFQPTTDLEHARDVLKDAGYRADIQPLGSDGHVLVRLLPHAGQSEINIATDVTTALKTVEPSIDKPERLETVGPQVGKELTEDGVLAVLFTFVLSGIYTWFRFQWKMGVSAVIATLHDPVIIFGFFSLTQIPFDLSVLAAILAVIGYSLNDTVVVFDRVRENFHSMRKMSSEQVLDASVNQTLSRTIITSGATLLVVLVLLLVGGETLRGFSWALTIGIVVGTYSSIYVAGALSLDLKLSARDMMEAPKEKADIDALP